MDADVIVVGAGPAGSVTAALLAERGVDVLLLERSAFPRDKACGEYFSPGVVDVLRRIGAAEAVLAREHREHLGMTIRTGRAAFPLRYDQAEGRRSLAIQRPLFDQALRDHATRRGVRVRHGVRALEAIVEQGRVVGLTVRAGTSIESLRARFVVAADGLHSTIARSLGLERPVRWPRRLGLIARYAVPDPQFPTEMHVGHALYCGLNPVGAQLVNVGVVGRLDAKHPSESTDAYFRRRLGELPGVVKRLAGAERVGTIRGMGPLARTVRRVSGPGYLLVGDAAGFFDPFTGEGVYRAVRGAELAATSIERALSLGSHDATDYPQLRAQAFQDKERFCALIQLFLGSDLLFNYALRRMNQRTVLATVFSGVLGDYLPAREAIQPSQLWALLRL